MFSLGQQLLLLSILIRNHDLVLKKLKLLVLYRSMDQSKAFDTVPRDLITVEINNVWGWW